VVTSTIVHEGGGRWREYVGDVQDWMTQSARAQALQRDAAPSAATPTVRDTGAASVQGAATAIKKKLSYKEQRELDALPQKISALEAEQADLEKQLGGGALYASDAALAAQLAARHAEIETEWLEAMERLEALGAS
jgi:ABC transport system ATP-binding/permease protein